MGPLKLTLKRKSLPVELEGEDGQVRVYKLLELNGRERDQYLNKMGDRAKFNAEGKLTGLKTFDGIQATLLSLCLFDPDGKLLTVEQLQAFPADTQNTLFEAAQKLNGLDKVAEEREKNA